MRSQRLALLLITLLVVGCGGDKDDTPSTDDSAVDEDGDGFSTSEDCDDDDPEINPGATETCDAVDEDCDGAVDEGLAAVYYADGDEDGYGNLDASTEACSQPEGYADNSEDCDDTNAVVNPGAAETCNELDDDCDSQTDEGVTTSLYVDADGDGFGDPSAPVEACEGLAGAVADSSDCVDDDAESFPGAVDVCDGVDNDCDGVAEGGAAVSWNDAVDGSGSWTDVSGDFSGTEAAPVAWTTPTAGQLCFAEGTHYVTLNAAHDLSVRGYAAAPATLSGASISQVLYTVADGLSVELLDLELVDGLGLSDDACIYESRGGSRGAGGLVCCMSQSSTLTLEAVVLRGGVAEMGGAVFSSACDVSVDGSMFSGNEASIWGGALTSTGGSLVVADSVFESNYSVQDGGAVAVLDILGPATALLTDVQISQNVSDARGGAVFVSGTGSAGAPSVSCVATSAGASRIVGNTSSAGGAAYLYRSSAFSSSGCDFGTGADDNSTDDVYVGDASTTYTYGDSETFACDASGCQ